MSKQSSIEWLAEQLTYSNEEGERFNALKDGVDLSNLINQAKEMHKTEIMHARHDGRQDFRDYGHLFKSDLYYYTILYK